MADAGLRQPAASMIKGGEETPPQKAPWQMAHGFKANPTPATATKCHIESRGCHR
jgi:hypothetical protein